MIQLTPTKSDLAQLQRQINELKRRNNAPDAVTKKDLQQYATKAFVREQVEGVRRTANEAKSIAQRALDEAKKKAEAVDAFARAQIAKLEAQFVTLSAQVAANTAAIAGLTKAVAAIKATLAKVGAIVAKLTPLLTLVGTILSFFSAGATVATFLQTSSRLNQLASQIVALGNENSRIIGQILTPLAAKVRRLEAQGIVTEDDLSRSITSLAGALNRQINQISGVANLASIRANNANLKAAALQSIVGVSGAAFTAKIISIVGGRYPNIGATNTVTRETRIIERTIVRQPIVTNTTINNHTREIRTNTVTNNNTVREVIRDLPDNQVDYNRIQTIANNAVRPTERVVSQTQRDVRSNGSQLRGIRSSITGLYGTVAQQAAQTRTWVQTQTQPIVNAVNGIKGQVSSLYNNQFVQTAINALNTIFHVHLAARMSFDAAQFVGDVVDQVLNGIGINFSDDEANDITLNQAIGNKLDGVVDAIIPDVTQEGIREAWLKSNTILRSASNIYWSIESMGDELRNVTEITNDRLGLWMNTARNDGVVGFDSYPHQPPISTGSRYGRTNAFLAKVNSGVDGWTNTIDSIEENASTVSYVASVPISIGDEVSFIAQERANIASAVTPAQNNVASAEFDQLLDNEAPETLVSPTGFLTQ